MKRISVIFTLVCMLCTQLFSQVQIEWELQVQGNTLSSIQALCLNAEKEIVLAGKTTINNQPNICLTKVNNFQELEWQQYIEVDSIYYIKDITSLQDGSYVLAGFKRPMKNSNSQGSSSPVNGWIIQCNQYGLKKWQSNYDGDFTSAITKIFQNQEGDLVFAGYTKAPIREGTSQRKWDELDAWVFKTDIKGEKIWEQAYGGNRNENIDFAFPMKEGKILVVGTTDSNDGHIKFGNDKTPVANWAFRINNKGLFEWDMGYRNDNASSYVSAADYDEDNGLVIASYILRFNQVEKKTIETIVINKYNESGVVVWTCLVDELTGHENRLVVKSIKATTERSYIALIQKIGNDNFKGIYLMKINNRGQIEWETKIESSLLTSVVDLLPYSEKEFIIAGNKINGTTAIGAVVKIKIE